MYGVVDCEGGGDQDFFDVGVVVGVPPELLVNGPPESFNLSIGTGVVATGSDSIDAQGGVEVIDDLGRKVVPAVCGDFRWDALKYMILFMRNLNAEDGLLVVVMPVKRNLLNASVAPRCKTSCFHNGRGHEDPYGCGTGASLAPPLSSMGHVVPKYVAVQFGYRFRICLLSPLLSRECVECTRIGEDDVPACLPLCGCGGGLSDSG